MLIASVLALAPTSTRLSVQRCQAAPSGTAGVVEIEVLTFASNDSVEEASALTDAMKHAMITAIGVTEHNAGGKGHALEAIALTVGCDDMMAPTFAPKIATEIKHDRFIYGTVTKSPPNKLTATLSFYNKGEVKTVAKTYDAGPVSKDGASPELKGVALDALYGLVGGAPKGKVDVTLIGPAAGESGDLFEGETKVGRVSGGHATVELPMGRHTLQLHNVEGYAVTSGTVEVAQAGGSLRLAPMELAPSKPLDWQLYGGIAAIAAGAVLVGVGVSASLTAVSRSNDPAFVAYRGRFSPNVGDICVRAANKDPGTVKGSPASPQEIAQANDVCNRSQTLTRQYVAYILGGVLIVGGTTLILTDNRTSTAGSPTPTPKAASVRIQPVFGPNYGSLSLVGSF